MFRVGAQLLLKNGHVFQSIAFSQLIYLGRFDVAIESLSHNMADEIIVTSLDGEIANELKNNSVILDQVNLPLMISGGADKADLSSEPVERALYNSALFNEKAMSRLKHSPLGFQSSVGYLPFRLQDHNLRVYDSDFNRFTDVDASWLRQRGEVVQEFVFLDAVNQGGFEVFNEEILDYLPDDIVQRSYFSGGIGKSQLRSVIAAGAAGYIIDNVSLYSNAKIFEEPC